MSKLLALEELIDIYRNRLHSVVFHGGNFYIYAGPPTYDLICACSIEEDDIRDVIRVMMYCEDFPHSEYKIVLSKSKLKLSVVL